MVIDYHIHSTFSADARSDMNDVCQSAIRFGLKEIGFAEHVDFDPTDPAFGFFDYEAYSSAIEDARQLFHGRLTIRKGAEIDYQSRFEETIRSWLRGRQFDFTIGSVHYVNGRPIDLGTVIHEELGRLYPAYCHEVASSITSGLFHVVGHVDLISSFYQIPSNIKKASINNVLDTLVSNKVSLEVNARGFREGKNDTVPNREILELFFRKGGMRISLGSDAHSAKDIGAGLCETVSVIRESDPDGQRSILRI
jgi:histidinol-phosphatase (PHP family)